jgi:hypothetical protein
MEGFELLEPSSSESLPRHNQSRFRDLAQLVEHGEAVDAVLAGHPAV